MTKADGFHLKISSGKIRIQRFGEESDRAVICVHGISSNARIFGPISEQLATTGRQVIAIDLRGRGLSDKTGAGTYGWKHHANDVLEVADELGIDAFDIVGHSMGAFVGMKAVALDRRRRIGKLVLIDGLGLPSPSAAVVIARNATRLTWVYRNADDYVKAVKSLGFAKPWSEHWERHYRYEVEHVSGGGVRVRTKINAIYEDAAYAAAHSPRTLWRSISIPTLVLRAARPLAGARGHVITDADLAMFLRSTPSAMHAEIDANHFGIVMHHDSASAIKRFLCQDPTLA